MIKDLNPLLLLRCPIRFLVSLRAERGNLIKEKFLMRVLFQA